jgi:antitoxin CptB
LVAPDISPAEAGRLRWRCRRGMKELDVVLERCLTELLPAADAAQRQAFSALLALPDPELAGYLLGGEIPGDAALRQWVGRIRGLCRLGDRPEYSQTESHSGRSW